MDITKNKVFADRLFQIEEIICDTSRSTFSIFALDGHHDICSNSGTMVKSNYGPSLQVSM